MEMDTRNLDSAKAVLLSAADLIDRFGWVKGRCGDTGIGFCIIGALGHVTDWTFPFDVINILECNLGMLTHHYNDTVATSKEVVVAKLREIANE